MSRSPIKGISLGLYDEKEEAYQVTSLRGWIKLGKLGIGHWVHEQIRKGMGMLYLMFGVYSGLHMYMCSWYCCIAFTFILSLHVDVFLVFLIVTNTCTCVHVAERMLNFVLLLASHM